MTVIGAREVYRVRTGRAIIIALFPKLLVIGVVATALLALIAVFVKMVAF